MRLNRGHIGTNFAVLILKLSEKPLGAVDWSCRVAACDSLKTIPAVPRVPPRF